MCPGVGRKGDGVTTIVLPLLPWAEPAGSATIRRCFLPVPSLASENVVLVVHGCGGGWFAGKEWWQIDGCIMLSLLSDG